MLSIASRLTWRCQCPACPSPTMPCPILSSAVPTGVLRSPLAAAMFDGDDPGLHLRTGLLRWLSIRLPPRFLQQPDIADDHPFVHSLAHVIYSQRRHRSRRQRFHLHAGLAGQAGGGLDQDRRSCLVHLEIHGDMRQIQRMAHGDQPRRLLGGHDAGDPRHRQHVALGKRLLPQQPQGLRAPWSRGRRPWPSASSRACRRHRPSAPHPPRPYVKNSRARHLRCSVIPVHRHSSPYL